MIADIQAFFQAIPVTQTIWVGYSGGLDSRVLLHLLKQAALPHLLRAVHVNHGLNAAAESWGEHCARVCDALAIPLTQVTVDATAPSGESPEAYARQKRYAALSVLLAPGDVLVTAHHQADQAETFLLQLLRGAGLPGLSAMGLVKPFAAGWLMRPLLPFTKAMLLRYAQTQGLQWVEDDSNTHLAFNRNYLRHQVLPVLQTRWPSVTKVIARVASHCAEAQALLTEIAQSDCVQGSQPNTLKISALLSLSSRRQVNALRYWIQLQNFLLPSEKQLQEIIKTMLYSRQEANPKVVLPQLEVRRYQDDLYLRAPRVVCRSKEVLSWDTRQTLLLPGIGKLIPEKSASSHHLFMPVDNDGEKCMVTVGFRQGGEIFHPAGRVGSHPLKKLLQEWSVPPWQRENIPLIYVNQTLACVAGFAVAEQFAKKATVLSEDFYFSFSPVTI